MFKSRIDDCIQEAKKVLNSNKFPLLPEDKDHSYSDKFQVTRLVSKCFIDGFQTVLKQFDASLAIKNTDLPITLHYSITSDCEFIKETTQKTPNAQYVTEQKSGLFKTSTSTESFTLTPVFHWLLKGSVILYLKTNGRDLVLFKDEPRIEVKTFSKTDPYGSNKYENSVLVTLLLKDGFEIDRMHKDCHTPSNNPEVKELLKSVEELECFLNELLERVQFFEAADEKKYLDYVRNVKIFEPIMPVLEDQSFELPNEEVFKQQHEKSLKDGFKDLATKPKVALLILVSIHLLNMCDLTKGGIDYIENLLREQLIAAIGKTVQIQDLNEYNDFHNQRIFKDQFRPKPFSIDVRRKGSTPEGVVTFEQTGNETNIVPVFTKTFTDGPNVKLALNSITTINLQAETRIHAFVSQQFSNQSLNYQLTARARQFSSFILLIGTMTSNDTFLCKSGFIIQNKDFLVIPLLTETIPTAKEFKDAIKSLSPSQQRFAQSFRQMQLSSTMFAFTIIQVKPQLESVLNLSVGALTKEIELTQGLINLFVEYQIPSDLLKYEEEGDLTLKEKVKFVENARKRVDDMIAKEKKEEYDARKVESELLKGERVKEDFSEGYSGPDSFGYQQSSYVPTSPSYMPTSAPVVKMRSFAKKMMPMMASAAPPTMSAPMPKPVPPPAPGSVMSIPVPIAESSSQPPSNQQNPPPYESQPVEKYSTTFAYTQVPTLLEKSFEKHLPESKCRPTIIKPSSPTTKTFQKGLTRSPETTTLSKDEQKTELSKAFDLLDALSRSGELLYEHCTLHIVIAHTQCFDETVMNTIIKNDCNPIEVIEQSNVVLANTIFEDGGLLVEGEMERIKSVSGLSL